MCLCTGIVEVGAVALAVGALTKLKKKKSCCDDLHQVSERNKSPKG